MPNSEHHRKLERMYHAAATNGYYRPTLRVGEGVAEVDIAVREDFFHPLGAVHGAVYFKALDDAAFFAVNSVVEDSLVLTSSFTTHFMRPVSGGVMTAKGRLLHGSRRLYVAEAELVDDQGRLLAQGSGTFMSSRQPLTEEMGYR